MRIDLATFGVEPPENSKTGRSGQPGSSRAVAGGASSADQTSLSFDQARVSSLEAQVLAQPEVRAEKVQALAQAVSQGDYLVPPSQIADALANDLAG